MISISFIGLAILTTVVGAVAYRLGYNQAQYHMHLRLEQIITTELNALMARMEDDTP